MKLEDNNAVVVDRKSTIMRKQNSSNRNKMFSFTIKYSLILSVVWASFTLDDLIEDNSWIDTQSGLTLRGGPTVADVFEDAFAEITRMETLRDVDDGPIDCLGLTPFLRQAFQWLFTPQNREIINVQFFLTTRSNRGRSLWSPGNQGHFHPVDFEQGLDLVLIIHGFMSNSNMTWVHNLTQSIINQENVNVVAVDWGGGSMSWKYWQAVGNTKVVGQQVAEFLRELLRGRLTRAQIHCIGHSLGAHICSYAARHVGIFGRITGLDPAQPCFNGRGLNSTDALYVDVIHTNTDLFGRFENLGTHDFYPNGGKMQPGCRLRDSVLLQKFPLTRNKLENAICSHGRSYEYYIDSINSKKCKFWGKHWDNSQERAFDVINEVCTPLTCCPMGLDSIRYPGKGGYFFPTQEKTPFCVEDWNATKAAIDWINSLKMVDTKWMANRGEIRMPKMENASTAPCNN